MKKMNTTRALELSPKYTVQDSARDFAPTPELDKKIKKYFSSNENSESFDELLERLEKANPHKNHRITEALELSPKISLNLNSVNRKSYGDTSLIKPEDLKNISDEMDNAVTLEELIEQEGEGASPKKLDGVLGGDGIPDFKGN